MAFDVVEAVAARIREGIPMWLNLEQDAKRQGGNLAFDFGRFLAEWLEMEFILQAKDPNRDKRND